MPSDLEQLATIKSQTLALIATITANPKPTYSIDGQSVDWSEYLRRLQETVAWCDQQLAAQAPFEFETRATT
jgi:hypothetical protein